MNEVLSAVPFITANVVFIAAVGTIHVASLNVAGLVLGSVVLRAIPQSRTLTTYNPYSPELATFFHQGLPLFASYFEILISNSHLNSAFTRVLDPLILMSEVV